MNTEDEWSQDSFSRKEFLNHLSAGFVCLFDFDLVELVELFAMVKQVELVEMVELVEIDKMVGMVKLIELGTITKSC